jgi:hypothetical protein
MTVMHRGGDGAGDQAVADACDRLDAGLRECGAVAQVGRIEQYSVFTTAQPPAAFMPRMAARVCG